VKLSADIFTMADEYSYAAFVGVLSNIYMKAHASNLYRDKPYRAAIVVSPSMCKPFRGQPESSLVRLQAIDDRMPDPAGGIEVEFHVAEKTMFPPSAKGGLKHTVSQAWPIEGAGAGKYITRNPPPEVLNKGLNRVRYFTLDVPGKVIDYNTPIEDLFNCLKHSKCHVCYQGGTAWLSVCMGIPTIIVHAFKPDNHLHYKTKLFGQDVNINILQGDKIIRVRRHPMEIHTSLEKLDAVLDDYS
jgi:hypothetical protein